MPLSNDTDCLSFLENNTNNLSSLVTVSEIHSSSEYTIACVSPLCEEHVALLMMANVVNYFSFQMIQSVTSRFSTDNMIGRGRSSVFYISRFPNGSMVAVKNLLGK